MYQHIFPRNFHRFLMKNSSSIIDQDILPRNPMDLIADIRFSVLQCKWEGLDRNMLTSVLLARRGRLCNFLLRPCKISRRRACSASPSSVAAAPAPDLPRLCFLRRRRAYSDPVPPAPVLPRLCVRAYWIWRHRHGCESRRRCGCGWRRPWGRGRRPCAWGKKR